MPAGRLPAGSPAGRPAETPGRGRRPFRCAGAVADINPVADVSASPASTTGIRTARRSAIRRAKVAPTGPLPIISTSMFSSISVHAFVVLRAHARCRCTENRYYSFVRPDKWFLMIAAIAGRDRSWLTRRGSTETGSRRLRAAIASRIRAPRVSRVIKRPAPRPARRRFAPDRIRRGSPCRGRRQTAGRCEIIPTPRRRGPPGSPPWQRPAVGRR